MSASSNMQDATAERIAARTTGITIPADAVRDLVRYFVWAAFRQGEQYVRNRVRVGIPFVGRWLRRLIEDVIEHTVGLEPVDLVNVAGADSEGDIVFTFPPPEPPATPPVPPAAA